MNTFPVKNRLNTIYAIFFFFLPILISSCASDKKVNIKGNDLSLDVKSGRLYTPKTNITYADGPYHYSISGTVTNGNSYNDSILSNKRIKNNGNETIITGKFPNSGLEISQVFRQVDGHIEETITLKNNTGKTVNIDDIRFGFIADISNRPDWRLCAAPFRIQLDASQHDYSTEELKKGQYSNTVYVDDRARAPQLTEEGRLRSEAWLWWNGFKGLTIIKYNNSAVELSVVFPEVSKDKATLQFGGAGYSLYKEPTPAHHLAPGKQFVFGTTIYKPFEGTIENGYSQYRDYLDTKGHNFPQDYNPPVNWNELYDVGWYFSDSVKLSKFYTRKAILEEAGKAKALGCEMMYFDPGWEVAEGLTLWDSTRLGSVSSMIRTLKDDYGLDMGYRTILHCGAGRWPEKYLIKHADYEPVPTNKEPIDMLCINNPEYYKIKLDRILHISNQGVKFMMFDGWNWFGTCMDTTHHHEVPLTTQDFIMAVYKTMIEVRQQCPGLTIEAHDPVWPWWACIYVPTYFQQGFGINDSHQEDWGFEYMWDCINDLKSGRALALYYYNLGCNVPLYLHITMAADNDNCVFFWWAASTIRHLGVGGKYGLRKPPVGYDPDIRFASYQKQMGVYKKLKPYFVRGEFQGLAENIHLHTLPNKSGGVITAFNLTNEQKQIEFLVPFEMLNDTKKMDVNGADAVWTEKGVVLKLSLPAMSPGVICLGESVRELN